MCVDDICDGICDEMKSCRECGWYTQGGGTHKGVVHTEPLVVDDVECKKMKKYDGTIQYARDKRRQVALAERFDKLWGPKGLHVYSMHPGWTETEGVKRDIPGFWDTFKNSFRPLEQGADTITYLALQVRGCCIGGGDVMEWLGGVLGVDVVMGWCCVGGACCVGHVRVCT